MTIPAGQLRLLPRNRGRESGPQYGSLLLILVVTYLLSAFTVAVLVSAVQVLLFLAVVLIALRGGRFRRKTGQLIAVGLLLGSVVAAILQLVDHTGDGAALASLWTALILLLAVFFIVRQVLGQHEITEQSIYGALSAYMMIGLLFAAVYVAVWRFSPHPPFFSQGETEDTKTFQYFSFTTLTTLGYGDFTAAGDGGRAFAVLEAMIGQMFLATLVARLVAGFRWSDRAAARHASHPATPGPDPGPQASGVWPGPGGARPDAALPRPGSGQPAPGQASPGPGPGQPGLGQHGATQPGPAQPGPAQPGQEQPGPGPASGGRSSLGPSRAKKASAPGLIRLSPPGAVPGRGTGPRPGGRKGAGGPGPVPAARPAERT
ncbi:MAG: ion channel [Streptosporangiaceae bacterium]